MHHVLLIGAGTMALEHISAYAKMDDVTIVGVVAQDREQVKKFPGAQPLTYFPSYEAAVATLDTIDLVDICLPTHLHRHYVERAARDGYHIICEKPLARTVEEARRMIDFCEKQGVRLFVGHVVRFFPEYVMAKQLVERGRVGEIAVARANRGGPFPTGRDDWYADYTKSGGVVLDLMIHDFDFLRWCFGDVERVYAKGMQGKKEPRLDYALVTLRFNNGVIAHVEGTWAHETFSTGFEFAGTTGVIGYDSSKEKPVILSQRSDKVNGIGVPVPTSPLQHPPYERELRHFLNSLDSNSEPLVTAEDALQAIGIAMAALHSIETGDVVHLQRKGEKV